MLRRQLLQSCYKRGSFLVILLLVRSEQRRVERYAVRKQLVHVDWVVERIYDVDELMSRTSFIDLLVMRGHVREEQIPTRTRTTDGEAVGCSTDSTRGRLKVQATIAFLPLRTLGSRGCAHKADSNGEV